MLVEIIKNNKAEILSRWRDSIVKSYPTDAVSFLTQERDRFNNPIGHSIQSCTERIFEGLVSGVEINSLLEAVDGIIRIRSVQDFSPSQAVAFISSLKEIVHGVCRSHLSDGKLFDEVWEFDARLDKLLLLAFDDYTGCREKIYEIRVNEIKNRSAILFEKAHELKDIDNKKA